MGKRDIKMSNPNYNPNYPDPSYNPNFNPSTPIPGDAPPSYNQIKGGQSIMTGYPPDNPANVVVLEERNIQGQKPTIIQITENALRINTGDLGSFLTAELQRALFNPCWLAIVTCGSVNLPKKLKNRSRHQFPYLNFTIRNLNIWIWYDQKGRGNPQPNFYPGVPGATVVPVVAPTVITPSPAIIIRRRRRRVGCCIGLMFFLTFCIVMSWLFAWS